MRLVDADELLEILRIMQEVYFDRKIILGKVVKEVKRMPTIEPERKKGIWKKGIGENGVTASLFCSRCNYENRLWYEWNYCPNCGAKMGEGEQNGQT